MANPTHADTQFTPSIFDLRPQFDACITTPSDRLYHTCQGVLYSAYTLRREIGYALDECHDGATDTCAAAFTAAGFPADLPHPDTLARCDMLGKLEVIELTGIPENSCLERIARKIERNGIRTAHNSDISCGINDIECAKLIDKGTKYWHATLTLQHLESLNVIPLSDEAGQDPTTSHRHYSLLKQRFHLHFEMDYRECLGETYARHWQAGLVAD